MPTYQFYRISRTNHIAAPGEDLNFEGDAQAREHAEALADGCAIDVWHGDRFVGHAALEAKSRQQPRA